MGFSWRKLGLGLKKGLEIASALGVPVPGLNAIVAGIHVVEDQLPNLKGGDKKAAAKEIAFGLIAASEAELGDLLNDAKVLEAVDAFIDAYVAAINAEAAVLVAKEKIAAAIAAVKATRQGDGAAA